MARTALRVVASIRTIVAANCGSNADADDPAGVPCKNHGADDATVPHHVAVAPVMTTIVPATREARTTSPARARREKRNRRVVATAAIIQRANPAERRIAI